MQCLCAALDVNLSWGLLSYAFQWPGQWLCGELEISISGALNPFLAGIAAPKSHLLFAVWSAWNGKKGLEIQKVEWGHGARGPLLMIFFWKE